LGVHKRVAVELAVPLRSVYQSTAFSDANGTVLPGFVSIHHRDGEHIGMGDIGAMARVRLIRSTPELPVRLDVRAGLTVPTGGIEPDPDELGRQGLAHQHVFFGSGTFDPQIGFDGSYDFSILRLVAFGFGHASLYANRYGYTQGARATGGMYADFTAGLTGWRFAVGPEVYHEAISAWGADVAENSGRTDLLVSAGVTWFPTTDWFIQGRIKAPLHTWAVDPITPPWFGLLTIGRQIRLFD
jgi:hypothetical protein